MTPQEKKTPSTFDYRRSVRDLLLAPDGPSLFHPFLSSRDSWCVVSVTTGEQREWFLQSLSEAASRLSLSVGQQLQQDGILVFDVHPQEDLDLLLFDSRVQAVYDEECPTRFYLVPSLDGDHLWEADLVLRVTDDLVYVEKSRDALRPEEPLSRREWLHFHGPRAV